MHLRTLLYVRSLREHFTYPYTPFHRRLAPSEMHPSAEQAPIMYTNLPLASYRYALCLYSALTPGSP